MSDYEDLFSPRGMGKCQPSLASRIDASGDCWLWVGPLGRLGYGRARHKGGKNGLAHRVVWESLVGGIPNDLEFDHLCRVRNCVNPDHLELVTHAENVARGTDTIQARARRKRYCLKGHPLFGPNLYVTPQGSRKCRDCGRRRNRESYARSSQTSML